MANTIRCFLGIAQTDTTPTVVQESEKNSFSATKYKKLADITDFPDLIGETERIDSSSMSDTQRTYEQGLSDSPSEAFTAKYNKANYLNIENLNKTNGLNALYGFCLFMENAENSVFTWVGSLSVGLNGGGIAELVTMPINIAFATKPELNTGTASISNDIITIQNT